MKIRFLLLLLLFSYTISAQLIITPGAQFAVTGNMQLTFRNTDLINNGNFIPGNSMASFTGNVISSISGNQPTWFSEIEINKTNNSSVRLQRAIAITNRVLFTSGFLNLNGFNADLGTTGHLDGEQENTRVIGPNGGEVLFTVSLNAPTNSNPANLGVFISAGQDLGNVTIKRGHQSQANIPGIGSSVLRYYNISSTNNTNLTGVIQFRYFNGELNGLDENSLSFFKSDNGINWTAAGFTSRDTVANFVEKAGIASFSRFTLSSGNNGALPVHLVLLNAHCEGNNVVITWKTAQEQNSSHFDIEKSADGNQWSVIGNRPAAGNSSGEKSYSFIDNNPVQNSFYRIAQYDLDGRVQYSSLLKSSCDVADVFSVSPNPFHDVVFINIVTRNQSQVTIRVFDNKGALVKIQRSTVLPGSNQLRLDIGYLANGVYTLSADWNNGQIKRAVKLLKQ